MLWGLAKLMGGWAPSGHRQNWWADGVPVMFEWRPGHVMLVSRCPDHVLIVTQSCCNGVPVLF